MRAPAQALARGRVALLRAVFVGAFAFLALRAIHLAGDERSIYRGEIQQHRLLALAPDRGPIVDRDGALLALSVDAPTIFAEPARIEDGAKTAAALARVLGQNARSLEKALARKRSFVYVARWVSDAQAKQIEKLALPGIGIQPEPRRTYPHGALAGPILGFANIDGVGSRGIEQQEDEWLRGIPKRLRAERDGNGNLLVATGHEDWETAGGSVALTLDLALQAQAEQALDKIIHERRARGGFVVAMDPGSGELLAIAQKPGFDPNRFRDTPFPATRSVAFLDAPEPGSTFKAFLVAAALEAKAIRASDRFGCGEGYFRVPGKTIRDTHECKGTLSTAEVLRVSSNIGAVQIALELGPRRHYEMLRRFGFGERSGSGFPDESSGLLRDVGGWRPVDAATAAFGQGLNTTPIQLAAAMSAIANGGELVTPRLVSARRARVGGWIPTRREVRRRVLDPEIAAQTLAMLEEVVSPEGTGSRAGLRGVRVAGKTGTAQKVDPRTRAYATDRYLAWFVGAAPADAPRIVIVAGVDEARWPYHTGGYAAAPLFAEVAAAELNRIGIATAPEAVRAPKGAQIADDAPPVELPDVAAPAKAAPPAAARRPEFQRLGDRLLMPDLRGLTVAEVRSVTERNRLTVEISGRGRAIAQDPSPGTIVKRSERPAVLRVRFAPDHRGAG